MDSVFCVCLVILQVHQENLLALDSFEQIMDYFKNKVPDIATSDLAPFFAEVSFIFFDGNKILKNYYFFKSGAGKLEKLLPFRAKICKEKSSRAYISEKKHFQEGLSLKPKYSTIL